MQQEAFTMLGSLLKEREEALAQNEFHPRVLEAWRAMQAQDEEWAPESAEVFDVAFAFTLKWVRERHIEYLVSCVQECLAMHREGTATEEMEQLLRELAQVMLEKEAR